jgi:hypothetical protein
VSLANRCEVCGTNPRWRIERIGDARVTWACATHLSVVCNGAKRPWEDTELTLKAFHPR